MLRRTPITWLVTGLAACGASQGKPAEPEIEDVDVEGNDAIGDGELIGGLATHEPDGILFVDYARYDPLEVDRDVDRIESYYQRRGYFSARVADVDVDDTGDRVEIRFVVNEGEPTRIADVSMTEIPESLEHSDPVSQIAATLEPGEVFDNQVYLEAKTRLRDELIGGGYAHAEVDGVVEVDRDRREARIRIEAKPGPLVRFGETEIVGLDDVPEDAVRARLAWSPGDVYDPELFEETRSQLYELGFFRGVRLKLAPGPGDAPAVTETRADVRLELSEVTDHEVRLGGGVAIDNAHYEVRARAGYTQYHFLDPLVTLRADLKPAYTLLRNDTGSRGFAGEGSVGLRREDLLIRRMRGEIKVSYRQVELEPYTSRGPGLRTSVGRPIFDGSLRVGAGWEIHRLTFPEIHPAIDEATASEIGLIDPYRVAFFDQNVALDRRDNILDPTEGFLVEVRLEESGAFAGSQFSYIKAGLDLRGYVPLSSDLVAAARFRGGHTLRGELPVTQRYFGGGAAGHRGFGSRRLSPNVTGTDPETDEVVRTQIGGEVIYESSAELRYRLTRLWGRWLSVVAFTDAGDVTPAFGDITGTPHLAGGLGLRYKTVVGPIRLDVAYRLNRTGTGEPDPGQRWAYHISLGEAF